MIYAEEQAKQQTSKLVGELDIIRFLDGWTAIDSNENIRLGHLIEILRRIEELKGAEIELLDPTGKGKIKVAGKLANIQHFEHACFLLSSLMNLAFFNPALERRDELVTNLNKLVDKIKADKARRIKIHPFLIDIVTNSINMILSKSEAGSPEFVSFVMSHLLFMGFDPMSEHPQEVFEHFKFKKSMLAADTSIKQPTIPLAAEDTGEFCFLYAYFKESLYNNPDHCEAYISDLLAKLRTIKGYLIQAASKGGKSALALHFIIKFFITKLPVLDKSSLSKLLIRLNFFINLPDPLGTVSMR